MAPETANPITLAGLIVLTLIPLVVYALWCDYFEQYLRDAKEQRTELNRAAELARIRAANFFALLFQVLIYFANSPIRKEHPGIGYPLFIGALLGHLWIQSGVERKLRGAELSRRARFVQAFRAIFWSTIAGFVYLSALLGSTLLFGTIGALARFHGPANLVAILMGMGFGVVGGITVCFALGPFFIRRIFSAKPLVHDEIASLFRGSGLGPVELYSIDLQQYHVASAMVAGFKDGKGFMKPSFFISQVAAEGLNERELRAVVLHEISHIKLNHLPNRLVYASGLVMCSGLATGLSVLLTRAFMEPNSPAAGMIACLSLAVSFLLAFHSLAKQSRLQEVLADIYCVDKLGADVDDLASALRKLDAMNSELPYRNGVSSRMMLMGHPSTEKRIKVLQYYFSMKNGSDDKREDQSKAA